MKNLASFHIPQRDEVLVTAFIGYDGKRYIDITQNAGDDDPGQTVRVADGDLDNLIEIIDSARKVLLDSYSEPPASRDPASSPAPNVPPTPKAPTRKGVGV